MINLNLNTDNLLTIDQGDKRYLRKYTQIPGLEEINDEIAAINTHLTSIDTQLTTLTYNTNIMNLNLYQPLLKSGDTKINNLSGLTTLINNSLPTGLTNLNMGCQDPFMAVINLNTTINPFSYLTMGNMKQNPASWDPYLSGIKDKVFGFMTLKTPTYSADGVVQNQIKSQCRYYDFALKLEDFKGLSISGVTLQIFIPDRIYNIYDNTTYILHTVSNDATSTGFNNTNIPWMYLYFRRHVKFNHTLFTSAFAAGASTFAATRLMLIFCAPICLVDYTATQTPSLYVQRTFMWISHRQVFNAFGIYHSNFHILLPEGYGVFYAWSALISSPKVIVNFTQMNSVRFNQGGWSIDGSGVVNQWKNTCWTTAPASNSSSTFITGTLYTPTETDGINDFIAWLLKLHSM